MGIQLRYKCSRGHWKFFALLWWMLPFFLYGQTSINGKLVDAETRAPLIGATVAEPDTDRSTITDNNGEFVLSITGAYIEVRVRELTELIPVWGGEQLIIPIPFEGYYEFEVVPVVAQKYLPTYQKLPATTQLSTAQILANSGVTIAPALNLVPGVFMHSGALNTNRITIRGIGNRSLFGTAKIRAYLDDIPLTTGTGETTIEDVDLSLLQKIAVVKGPAASLFGAGLGGLIQMSTQNSRYDPLNELSVHNSFGSYGLSRQVVQLMAGKSNQYQLKLGFNNTHSDGYRDNNQYDRTGFTAIGNFYSTNKHQFNFIINHTDLKAFIPSSLNRTDYLESPRKAAFTWAQIKGFEDYEKTLVGVSHRGRLASQLNLHTSLFSTHRNAYESRPFNILREKSDALGGRTYLSFFGIETSQITGALKAGVEYFYENLAWTTNATNGGVLNELLSDNEEARSYANLFLQSEWDFFDHLHAVAGINWNTTQYRLTDRFPQDSVDRSARFRFQDIWSPYLSLSYDLTPLLSLREIGIYSVVSHGFSPPTLEETLTPEGNRNPDIQPERGWNIEIGLRGRFSERLDVEAGFYTLFISDLLVARRTALDQFIGINAGKTRHQGFDLALKYDWLPSNLFRLASFLNYSYSDYSFTDFIDGEDDFSGNELTGTAPHHLRAGIDAQHQPSGLFVYADFRYVDDMPLRDDNSIYSEPYSVLNLKVGWQVQFAQRWRVQVHGGINNVLDEKYASMFLINAGSFGGSAPRYYYPGLPRNYYGGMQLTFLFKKP